MNIFSVRTAVSVAASLASFAAFGQTIDPFYASSYNAVSLGTPVGVTPNFGGLTLKAGSPNTLLLGGAANGGSGVIDSLALTRAVVDGKLRITGFAGAATPYSTAPGIDGGLTYAPNGNLIYTSYPDNKIGQIKPGSVVPDVLTQLPDQSSVGSILFAPGSSALTGSLKVLSYNASVWYTVSYTQNASGLYDFGPQTNPIALSGGLEGAVYVPAGSPLFPTASVLVSEYGSGNVVSYSLDANKDPIPGTRKLFVSGLSGAEGAFIDPTTGDFLFSTFGGQNQVVAVRGFAAVPEPASFAALGLGLLAFLRRRSRA